MCFSFFLQVPALSSGSDFSLWLEYVKLNKPHLSKIAFGQSILIATTVTLRHQYINECHWKKPASYIFMSLQIKQWMVYDFSFQD